MLFGNDVVDMEREQWTCLLRQQAVFTAITSTAANKITSGVIHATPGVDPGIDEPLVEGPQSDQLRQ